MLFAISVAMLSAASALYFVRLIKYACLIGLDKDCCLIRRGVCAPIEGCVCLDRDRNTHGDRTPYAHPSLSTIRVQTIVAAPALHTHVACSNETLNRRLKEQQDRDAAKAKELHLLKLAAAAVASMEEAVKKRIDAEMEAMALEDRRSKEVRPCPAVSFAQRVLSLDFGYGADRRLAHSQCIP